MEKKQIRYIRLDDHEDAIVQAVADQHGTSMAAATRFIIRDWKRLSLQDKMGQVDRFVRDARQAIEIANNR